MSDSDASFSDLYAQHRDELYRYVARFTGDPDLADDVVQDTFVRLREKPPPDRTAVRGWLFTVATNAARDALKGSTRRRTLLDRGVDRVPHGGAPPAPDVFAERRELAGRIRMALDQLNEKERTIVLMREAGFAHHEIAEAVDTTTKSVGTMIARALDKLARVLEPEVRG